MKRSYSSIHFLECNITLNLNLFYSKRNHTIKNVYKHNYSIHFKQGLNSPTIRNLGRLVSINSN